MKIRRGTSAWQKSRKRRMLKGTIADMSADVEKREDAFASLVSEIAALQKRVADLDKSVVEAT